MDTISINDSFHVGVLDLWLVIVYTLVAIMIFCYRRWIGLKVKGVGIVCIIPIVGAFIYCVFTFFEVRHKREKIGRGTRKSGENQRGQANFS
jgi:hypothetical protein